MRKECKDLRMMTGKKVKLTLQEKQEKRKEAVKDRDIYNSEHLGGFTQIYPLPQDHPRQAVYEQLIKVEAEASGAVVNNTKRQPKPQSQTVNHRNTQKIGKLPLIRSLKDY